MDYLQQIKYKNNLILTTEQLADFYKTSVQQIQQNFVNNKNKFIEGKHYYYLDGAELKQFKNYFEKFEVVGKRAPSLYLWTKRGASRHSKMLGTDQAWDMFDELEENYFNPKQQVKLPHNSMEVLELFFQSQKENTKDIKEVKHRVVDLEDNQTIAPGEYTYISHQVSKAVHEYVRTHDFVHTQQQRAKLYKDISRGLNEVTGVKTRTQLRRKNFETADEFISNWQPSTATIQIIKQIDGEAARQTSMEV